MKFGNEYGYIIKMSLGINIDTERINLENQLTNAAQWSEIQFRWKEVHF
jgi:hypothetical protein